MTNCLSDNFGAYPVDSTGAGVDKVPDVGYVLDRTRFEPALAAQAGAAGATIRTGTEVVALAREANGWRARVRLRYWPGDSPVMRLKTTERYSMCSKPVRPAMLLSGRSLSLSSSLTRASCTRRISA